MSKIDEYRKQLKQIEDLRHTAIAELETMLKEAQGHVDRIQEELDQLTSAGTRAGKKKASKTPKKRQIDPDKPCSICKFATVPNHDARKHRGQQDKKAFTVKELGNLGFQKA